MKTLAVISNKAPSSLKATDADHLALHLQILDANLPRRKEDAGNGELKAEAQFSILQSMPRLQIEFLCGEALKRLEWYPTIKQLLDIASEWKSPTAKPGRLAKARIDDELTKRFAEFRSRLDREIIAQDEIDALPQWLKDQCLRPYGSLTRCSECGSYAQIKTQAVKYQQMCADMADGGSKAA